MDVPTERWKIPKISDPSQRPFYLSTGMFLAGLGWFWDQHASLTKDNQKLENRIVALESLEVRGELKDLNKKLDKRFDELRSLLDARTRRRR